MGEAPRDQSGLSLKLFLFEGVDEFDGGEEPDALAVALDGLDADRRGEMRLARNPPGRAALSCGARAAVGHPVPG